MRLRQRPRASPSSSVCVEVARCCCGKSSRYRGYLPKNSLTRQAEGSLGWWGEPMLSRLGSLLPSVTVRDYHDAINYFFARGWTDGLPVVPPTAALVQAMLEHVQMTGAEEVGSVRERRLSVTTAQAAVCAVMAGAPAGVFSRDSRDLVSPARSAVQPAHGRVVDRRSGNHSGGVGPVWAGHRYEQRIERTWSWE